MKIGFEEGTSAVDLLGGGLFARSTLVAKNCRVDTTIESLCTNVRVGADPVVANILRGMQDEGITLA